MSNQEKVEKVWVIIPASGIGSRMQSAVPKQYLLVHGKTILEHTIRCFIDHCEVAGILVVTSESDSHWDKLKQSICKVAHRLPLHSTVGGAERADTVLKGLSYLSNTLELKPNQWVMVHDAARPCLKEADIDKLLAVRFDNNSDGGILATPVRDTLKRADATNAIIETPSRDALWQAQTPQLFKLAPLLTAIRRSKQAGLLITDEASAMEQSRRVVRLVEGSSDNIKVTTPSDLKIVNCLIEGESR